MYHKTRFTGQVSKSKETMYSARATCGTRGTCDTLLKMCYNCGCGLPKDDMGKGVLHKGGGSLVEEDFEYMAKEWGMSVEDTKKNTLELLKKQLEEKKTA